MPTALRALAPLLCAVVLPFLIAPPLAAEPAWVTHSNAEAHKLMAVEARFAPEFAAQAGFSEYDAQVSDLGPRLFERNVAALSREKQRLQSVLRQAQDANLRQDLQILIDRIDIEIAGQRLNQRLSLMWFNVPELVFGGLQNLLDDQVATQRRVHARERLQRYVGSYPGSRPMVELAKARFAESRAPGRLAPLKSEVEQMLADVPTYVSGIRDLFAKYHIEGADADLARLDKQFADYAAWTRATVLPLARSDYRQPRELYAHQLRSMGIDIAPELLMQRAEVAFMETRAAMQALAPRVARELGVEAGDYRELIRKMKTQRIPDDELEARYANVNTSLEAIIRRERIVDLPQRPMLMRLASPAESAAEPAPHMRPPRLVGNTGERGQFVLPVSNPDKSGEAQSYDDFNHDAATWTLSAHEGRPGHELQFSAMVERGVSVARSLFAFNSVNVEGWALYAEAESLPYEPPGGQMIALQFRLLRAARAMLDPMLNLGLIKPDTAYALLTDTVMLSPAMARQEVDRYTFRAPGQAGSYFYGYSRLLELRADTELALGAAFDRQAFNNFVVGQGLLPPSLLARAVREEFIPAQRALRP